MIRKVKLFYFHFLSFFLFFNALNGQAEDALSRVLDMDDANVPALMLHALQGLTQAGQVQCVLQGWAFQVCPRVQRGIRSNPKSPSHC